MSALVEYSVPRRQIIIGGWFDAQTADGEVSCLVSWDGTSLSGELGGIESGFSHINALEVLSVDGVDLLFAAGEFGSIGHNSTAVSNIARWNGLDWQPLGEGLNGEVINLEIFDDGRGPALYAGGRFTHAGPLLVNRIARWDGSAWEALGVGVAGSNPSVKSLCSCALLGGQPVLVVGGNFGQAGGLSAGGLAKWNGQSWTTFGGWFGGAVLALHHTFFAGEPTLYVGGLFMSAAGFAPQAILAMDETGWHMLGTGLSGASGLPEVRSVAEFNDGESSAVYVGGYDFTHAGGTLVRRFAKWDGDQWHAIAPGPGIASGEVNSLLVSSIGYEPGLYIGGQFTEAGPQSMQNMARYVGCFAPCPADLSGDREITTDDLNILLSGFGCTGDPGSCPGDIDEDGDTDTTDLNIVLSVFGTSCPN